MNQTLRYNGIKLQFEALIYDKLIPMNQDKDKYSDFEKNYMYWLSTTFQVEKVTEQIMLYEQGDDYKTLAHVLHNKFVSEAETK